MKPLENAPLKRDDKEIGRRIVSVRYLLGFRGHGAITAFCKKYPSLPIAKRWGEFEEGTRPIQTEQIEGLILILPDLTVDWLLYGRVAGLPVLLRQELETAAEAAKAGGFK